MNRGNVSLKTIIVLVILALVGVLSFLGMDAAKTYLSGASAGSEPKNVLATPGEDGKSAVISWATDKAVQAVVEYGTTPASLLLRSLETDAAATHRVNLSPLKAATSYYFRIRVGEEVYDNSGIPFSFKTKASGAVASPTVTRVPTSGVPTSTSGCSRSVDYNRDGTVNSVDFVFCMNGSKTTPAVVPTKGVCDGVDFDHNGVINSIDRIKCLQNR